MKKNLSLILLLSFLSLFVTSHLYAAIPSKNKIEHTETMHKDLTGDGIKEKLVFSYSGSELIHLAVSFRIYQIDPKTKTEKEIYSEVWNTWDIYTDLHGPDYSIEKVKYYITNFFNRFCFDSSKNKMCQSKCLGSLWCREEDVKQSIASILMGKKKYYQWRESTLKAFWQARRKKRKAPNFDKHNEIPAQKQLDSILASSLPVDKNEIEHIFQEIFIKNDIPCFGYEPYPEDIQMFVWSPSLKRFISIGGCH